MSYPGGFSRLRIGDGGTQRIAIREDNMGSWVEEGPFSTSAEDPLSCVDATRVITWLRPVGKSRVDAFWKKFSFPLNVQIYFSFLETSFCRLYERGSRWNEFHLLVKDSY